MPKPKQFLKENKKKSKHAPVPTTADEYLEAGVDFEEAGEKWRGGDAAKSTRFFVRALDAYGEGLKKFPDSFDLAYNKARLQFDLTQYPKLLEHLPGNLVELLQTALESSRYALKLDPDDTDALFNTAEILVDFSKRVAVPNELAIALKEALWLFQLCLERQIKAFDSYQAGKLDIDMMDKSGDPFALPGFAQAPLQDPFAHPGFPRAPSEDPSSVNVQSVQRENKWARLFIPTTEDTIIDTLVAQLETLATLAQEVLPQDKESRKLVDSYYKDTLSDVVARFLKYSHNEELQLALANYQCAEAGMRYNTKKISLEQYGEVVKVAYNFNTSKNPKALCDKAESILDFHDAIRLNYEPHLGQCWDILTSAQDLFTRATKLPDCTNKDTIYTKLGDVELLRFQLGHKGEGLEIAAKNAGTLLKNASRFYKEAIRIIESSGVVDSELEIEARIKSAIVDAFSGDGKGLLSMKGRDYSKNMLEALEDGVVTAEQLGNFGWN